MPVLRAVKKHTVTVQVHDLEDSPPRGVEGRCHALGTDAVAVRVVHHRLGTRRVVARDLRAGFAVLVGRVGELVARVIIRPRFAPMIGNAVAVPIGCARQATPGGIIGPGPAVVVVGAIAVAIVAG
jgi:hypothetical protein